METKRSKWRRVCLRLALALGSTFFAVVVIELGYRVYMFGWGALSPTQMHSLHRLGRSGLLQRSPLPGLRYEYKPNLETRYHMQPFVTNSRGMRDREYPLEKPADTFRVAVIGDSWTMGSGVAIEEVYHSLIESQLNERGGAMAVEFLNFGVAGYELWDYVGLVEQKVQPFDPNLILVALSGTDQVVRVRGKPAFRERPELNPFWTLTMLEDFRLQRANSAKKKKQQQQTQQQQQARRQQEQEQEQKQKQERRQRQRQRQDPMPKPAMVYLRQTISELTEASKEAEIPLVICYLNMAFNPKGQVTRAFERVCGENGLPYRDLGSAFRGYAARQFWIFREDHHANAEGHAMFAAEVLKYLESEGLLPR